MHPRRHRPYAGSRGTEASPDRHPRAAARRRPPRDLLAVVDRLTFLQLDPTAAVAPSADLVAWSRLGDAYDPAQLQRALERDRTMFEHRAQPVATEPMIVMVRPMADLGLYLADMAAWPAAIGRRARMARRQRRLPPAGARPVARRRARCRRATSPTRAEVPWASTGWTNDRNVTQMLEFLASRGEVAVAGRRGRQRLWDLADAGLPERRARSCRATRRAGSATSGGCGRSASPARSIVGEAGVAGRDRGHARAVAASTRTRPPRASKGGPRCCRPFDRLIHDRPRALELFDFEYTLEMYKPKAKRRWGYFALPVLHHDRLVGKVDAIADRKTSQLVVHAVHQDVPFTRAMAKAVNAELDALARWLGLVAVRDT